MEGSCLPPAPGIPVLLLRALILESCTAVHATVRRSRTILLTILVLIYPAAVHPPALTDWNCSSLLAPLLPPAINTLM